MSDKSKKHFLSATPKPAPKPSENHIQKDHSVIVFPSDLKKKHFTHETIMETPLYVCEHPSKTDRILRVLLRNTPVIILSKNSEPWLEIETTNGPYIRGFVLSMFLRKVKEEKDA